jgi:hypothetical protein
VALMKKEDKRIGGKRKGEGKNTISLSIWRVT